MNTEQERAEFEVWWEKEGQYCRAGGGDYEKTFAYRAYQAGRAALQSPEIQALRKDVERMRAALKRISAMDSMSYHSLDSAKITAKAAMEPRK